MFWKSASVIGPRSRVRLYSWLSLFLTAGLCAWGQAQSQPATDWFSHARLGVFMHFTLKTPAEFKLTETFDAEALARQLQAMGARYFVFTIYHQNSDYLNAPNATYDRYTGYQPGERCATRDLPLELYRALHPKGIKLLLYVTSQTPRNDLRAHRAFGLPETKGDVKMDAAFARKWAEVLQEWSDRYGDKVAGWWFDGCYQWIGFNEEMAGIYAAAVRHGNPQTLVAFNPGVKIPIIRATRAENYTAGETDQPFMVLPASRWVEGAQWHCLTYLGSWWKQRDTRYATSDWINWGKAVTDRGGVVTLDLGPNLDPQAGPIGALDPAQMNQFRAIRHALDEPSQAATITGAPQNDFAGLVDMRMGQNGGSSCVIGPQLPDGSANPSPQTPDGGFDGYAPDRPVRGFGQLHVTGTGWGCYGQMLLSPQVGLAVGETEHDSPVTNEEPLCYAYDCTLTRYGIRVQVAPAHDAAIYRLQLPATNNCHLVLDVGHSIAQHIAPQMQGHFHGGTVTFTNNGKMLLAEGTYSGGFGNGRYPVFAACTIDADPAAMGTWNGAGIQPGKQTLSATDRLGAYWRLDGKATPEVTVRIGISLQSLAMAEKHLAEVQTDYDTVAQRAHTAWNRTLSSIVVTGGTAAERRLFYTALYQSHLMPRDRTADHGTGQPWWDDHYATWDTWYSKLPLYAWLHPQAMAGIVNSYGVRLAEGGSVADAFIFGKDAVNQGGDDPDNVIADAWAKQIPGIDWNAAFRVLRQHAEHGRSPVYREHGWLPAGQMSCSRTLEYAFNDWCAAQVAAGLGHTNAAARWQQRAQGWRELWNPAATNAGFAGFVVPRRADGNWVAPFDVTHRWGSWDDYFYEGTAWEYSLTPVHDLPWLMRACGGRKSFLDRVQFAVQHGLADAANEISFRTPFLPALLGDRAAACRLVAKVRALYGLPQGYPGNEDSGAMASWYVFTSLGLFPLAGTDRYAVTTPAFPRAVVRLTDGHTLTLERGARLTVDGQPVSAPNLLHHAQLIKAHRITLPGPDNQP